jgi:hypothetical protein
MSVVGKSGGGLGGMSLKRAPQGPPRIIAPRAVRREPHQQIIEEYLCAILHHEREPLGPRTLADIAAQPDKHMGKSTRRRRASPHSEVTIHDLDKGEVRVIESPPLDQAPC